MYTIQIKTSDLIDNLPFPIMRDNMKTMLLNDISSEESLHTRFNVCYQFTWKLENIRLFNEITQKTAFTVKELCESYLKYLRENEMNLLLDGNLNKKIKRILNEDTRTMV